MTKVHHSRHQTHQSAPLCSCTSLCPVSLLIVDTETDDNLVGRQSSPPCLRSLHFSPPIPKSSGEVTFPSFQPFSTKRLFLHRQPQWDEAFHKGWSSQMLSCEFFCFDEAIKRPLPVKACKIFVCQIQRFYGWIPPIKTAEVPEEKSSQDFPRRLCCCCGVCSGSNIADGSTVDGPNYGHW